MAADTGTGDAGRYPPVVGITAAQPLSDPSIDLTPGVVAIATDRLQRGLRTHDGSIIMRGLLNSAPVMVPIVFLCLLAVLFVQAALVRDVRGYACPYGAVPMTWTEMDERHRGCMNPSGDRHGPWSGSRARARVWEAFFRFDELVPNTAFQVSVDGSRESTTRFSPRGVR